MEAGIRGFDTAPSYGNEAMLGASLKAAIQGRELSGPELCVATKLDGWQMLKGNGDVSRFVEEACCKLGVERIDLMLVHWPFPELIEGAWRSLLNCREAGKVDAIGVCNVRLRHLEEFLGYSAQMPQVVQIERHPLRVCADEVSFCHDHGIVVQAYSPMCRMDRRIVDSPVFSEIVARYGRTAAQIMMRWHLDTGVVPVFMSSNPDRIRENVDVAEFVLDPEDVARISGLDQDYKIFLESWGCPGF